MAVKWKVAGSYFEACNCEVNCPCAFNSPPNYRKCTGLTAWSVKKGNYGKISLDGTKVGGMWIFEGLLLESRWKVIIYVNENDSAAQREANGKIFSGQAGGPLAKLAYLWKDDFLGVKTVPIKILERNKARSIEIKGIADARVEKVRGLDGGEVQLVNAPLSFAPGFPATVAKSTRYKYNDKDLGEKWEISNRASYMADFEYSGP